MKYGNEYLHTNYNDKLLKYLNNEEINDVNMNNEHVFYYLL